MSYEEILRRSLVAAAKEAGTLIREKELKRQALTVSINRPIVESLIQTIDAKLSNLPDLREEVANAASKALAIGKPILDTALNAFIKGLLQSLPFCLLVGLRSLRRYLVKQTNR